MIDCNILQDQVLLGSCIVGYGLEAQITRALNICVLRVYDRKRLHEVNITQSVNMYESEGKCKCPD